MTETSSDRAVVARLDQSLDGIGAKRAREICDLLVLRVTADVREKEAKKLEAILPEDPQAQTVTFRGNEVAVAWLLDQLDYYRRQEVR